MIRHVNSLGWEMYATDHEDANGQFEQNFAFADALTTCDRAVFYRYMVEAMAQERGLIATFMPKPFAHLTGNGAHFHMSLWDGETNLFMREPGDDPRGLGLSEVAYQFIAGLKEHAKAYIALTAPTVSSYKRLVIGAPASGATWAPAYVTYGYNNRTMMLRIPEAGRIEDRTVDGSCNPYLAATAVLAAGLDGIERGLDPGDPTTAQHVRDERGRSRARWGSRRCRPTCSTRPASSRATTSCARRSARSATRTTSTTSSAASGASGRRRTSRSRSGSSTATCSTSEVTPMCGIAGLFSKSGSIEEQLGAHLSAMLSQLADRGPDSAGVALYRDPAPAGPARSRCSRRQPAPAGPSWRGELGEAFGAEGEPEVRASHALFVVPAAPADVQALARASGTPSCG